jgi:hypothetical protein
MNMRVYPTDKTSPFWPPNPANPFLTEKLYTFVHDIEFPPTARVSIYPRNAGLSKETLSIKIDVRWIQLKQWLASKICTEGLVGETGFKAQQQWWKLDGGTFRLMDLPNEKRLETFKFAFGPRLYPVRTVPEDQSNDAVARGNAAVHSGFGCYNFDDWEGRCQDIPFRFWSKHTTVDYSVQRGQRSVVRVRIGI